MERTSEGCDYYILLQGTFFSLLGLSWLTRIVFRQRARTTTTTRPLVLYTSLSDIALALLASLGTILLNTQHTNIIITAHQLTLYAAFGLSSVLSVARLEGKVPRAGDKFLTTLTFILHLHFTVSKEEILTPSQICSVTAIAASAVSSAMSTYSVPAAARYIWTVSTVMFCSLQGTWTIHSTIKPHRESLVPILFSVHILTIFTLYMIVLAVVRIDHKWLKNIKTSFTIGKILKTGSKKISQEKLVRESLNETVETEPINFSFYFKDEISDEIKNVMKTIDEMLINETGKSLEDISEEPELKEAIENVYVNVNIIRNVLDDSKLEESEVM